MRVACLFYCESYSTLLYPARHFRADLARKSQTCVRRIACPSQFVHISMLSFMAEPHKRGVGVWFTVLQREQFSGVLRENQLQFFFVKTCTPYPPDIIFLILPGRVCGKEYPIHAVFPADTDKILVG